MGVIDVDLLTWNVNFRTADALDPIRRLTSRPDILTLQEVTVKHLPAFSEALAGMGFAVLDSCDSSASEKRYGNVVAVRPGIGITWAPVRGFYWPQLALHVRLHLKSGPLSVVTVHIPNGSGNGWRKVEALEALRRLVSSCASEPLIVTGDFNEPRFEPLQESRVITWGQDWDGIRWSAWDRWTFDGVTDTGERWDSAVQWFFDSPAGSGLRNAFWEQHGLGTMEASHVSNGSSRWFDHILVSRQFGVKACDYVHSWRTEGFSDHSPLRALLSYAPD